MESRDEILRELKDIAPKLAALPKTNLYRLPHGYFENFKTVMLHHVKMADATQEITVIAPALSKLDKQKEDVPAGYFANFSANLLNKVRAEEALNELSQIAPVLSKLEKVNLYEAPANYFSTLPVQLAKAVKAKQKEPAITMPPVLHEINAVLERIGAIVFKPRYAFAFSGMATMVIISAMLFTKIEECNDLDCKFAQLSDEELNSYITNNQDEFHRSIMDISTDDKRLLNRNAKGDLSFDDYVSQQISDDELSDMMLD